MKTQNLPNGVTAIQLKDWNPSVKAYLWVEVGNGYLLPIINVDMQSWWCKAGGQSWSCIPITTIYQIEDASIKNLFQSILREQLAARRNEYKRKEKW